MIKTIIITGPGFQDEEYVYPYYRLKEAGYEVDVCTKDGNDVIGKYGVPARATRSVEGLNPDDYDMVLLPGGFEAPDRVRLIPEALEFVRGMNEQGKLVAAICHGPWIMISAGITRGRKMTAFWSIEADMINSGADYQHKAPLVIDGNFITSPHYNHNGEWMAAVIDYMENYRQQHNK